MVFFRAPTAHLVVAGENQEAIRSIKTRFNSNKLIIEQEGVSISSAGSNIHVSGSGDIDAHVTQSVKARVAGSGDIAVHGSPPSRDHPAAGFGDIKFKKK